MYKDFEHTLENQLIWCNKFTKFNSKALLFSSYVKEVIKLSMIKIVKLNSSKLDIAYLTSLVKDKRQFYREVNNILQKVFI